MGVMMFDSSYAYDSLRVAVKAAFDAKIINGKLELTSEQTKIISEADLKIAIISGDGSYSVKTVDGINGFKEFIIAGGEFSKDVPGDPIFYSRLGDDSPFCKIQRNIHINNYTMRITSIFLFTIIIFGGLSCSNDDSLIHNKTKGILEKYPEPTVTITAHNHIPFLAKNILEEKAITKSVNIISDIAWANGFGRTITARSDEMVIPDNMNRYIYPGSILEASSIAETRFTPIPVKNNPVHVSVSFPAKKVGGTIKEPSLLNIRQFVMDLMQQNNIGKQSATLSFDVQKFVSYDELKMTFGSNENTGLLFWGTSSAQYQNKYRIIRSSGLCIKFIQKYFTLDMDIPSNGLISGTIPGGYSPVCVSSIAYGRIGILTLETNYDYEKANKLVKETFNSLFINKNNTLTKEQEAFFNSAEMKVFIAGGSGVTGVKTIGGIKEFTNYITEGGEFSASS